MGLLFGSPGLRAQALPPKDAPSVHLTLDPCLAFEDPSAPTRVQNLLAIELGQPVELEAPPTQAHDGSKAHRDRIDIGVLCTEVDQHYRALVASETTNSSNYELKENVFERSFRLPAMQSGARARLLALTLAEILSEYRNLQNMRAHLRAQAAQAVERAVTEASTSMQLWLQAHPPISRFALSAQIFPLHFNPLNTSALAIPGVSLGLYTRATDQLWVLGDFNYFTARTERLDGEVLSQNITTTLGLLQIFGGREASERQATWHLEAGPGLTGGLLYFDGQPARSDTDVSPFWLPWIGGSARALAVWSPAERTSIWPPIILSADIGYTLLSATADLLDGRSLSNQGPWLNIGLGLRPEF